MSGCLFCRIVSGDLAAAKVFESPHAVAFLDRFPAVRGHALVVPRTHVPTILELPDAEVGGLFEAVKVVTRKVSDALRPVAFNVGWNHGAAAGQHVFHLHVHVIPRYVSGGRGVQTLGGGGELGDLEAVAESIRRA